MPLNDIKFGRLEPKDWKHVDKYPIEKLQLGAPPTAIEVLKPYPKFLIDRYNQGDTGCCVGYSYSWDASYRNSISNYDPYKYNAKRLYVESRIVGGYRDPYNMMEGSALDYACQVLAKMGHWRTGEHDDETWDGNLYKEDGISKYVWATNVNGLRTALASGFTAVLGIAWANTLMTPLRKGGEWWVELGQNYNFVGGHAIACIGVSDERSAIALLNTWGPDWADGGVCWLSYNDFTKIMAIQGEISVITDIPGAHRSHPDFPK